MDEDRYMGPFDRETGNPVLLASTLYDPATRYQGALTVHSLLPNSRLLTVEGWGHTTLFSSQCADQVTANYLLDPNSIVQDTVCAPDFVLFESASSLEASFEQATRGALRFSALRLIGVMPRSTSSSLAATLQ